MKIKPIKKKVSQIYNGYFNDDEEGVVAYDEKLNVRPKYQREFVYKDEQRDEVIRTVMKNFPLNVFYLLPKSLKATFFCFCHYYSPCFLFELLAKNHKRNFVYLSLRYL